jgi:hypothetical protein
MTRAVADAEVTPTAAIDSGELKRPRAAVNGRGHDRKPARRPR